MNDGKTPLDDGKLPYDPGAEQALIGALLRDPETIPGVAERVSPSDFHLEAHHDVYQAILALSMEDRPPDLILIGEYLTAREKLEDLGGMAFLRSLAHGSHPENTSHYVEIVRRHAQIRRVIAAGLEIADLGYSHQGQDAATILGLAETALLRASESGIRERGHDEHVGGDLADQMIQRMRDAATRGITGLATGLIDLDRVTAGLQPGTVSYLAARPGMGKSAFTLNIARNVGSQGKWTLFYTLEMPSSDMENRLFSMESGVPFEKIKSGRLTEMEWGLVMDARERFRGLNIILHHDSYMTVSEIRTHMRRHMSEHPVDLVVIDYCQILNSDDKQAKWNRVTELDSITKDIQRMAAMSGVPFLVCAQVSRGPEAREDKRPRLSDLRESGGIENTADMVMFLYRDSVYNADSDFPNVAELIIEKQRSGPTGTLNLLFQKEIQRFASLARVPGVA